MTPAPFDKKAAHELIEDVKNDLERIDRVHHRLEISEELLSKPNEADPDTYYKFIEAAASELHDIYTGTEKILERIITFSTGQRLQGKDSHQVTLKIAHEQLKITSEPTDKFLRTLSSFRHLFRHAYGLDLDPAKIIKGTQETSFLWSRTRNELEAFLQQIKEKIDGKGSQTRKPS